MNEKRSSLAHILIALVLLLPFLYAGSYWLLLDPIEFTIGNSRIYRNADYRGSPAVARTASRIFRPLHWLDKKVRREYWKSPYEP